MNDLNTEEKVCNYNLVEYGKKVPLALITKDSKLNWNTKVFRFSEEEAHDLNMEFARARFSRAGKRYVRV